MDAEISGRFVETMRSWLVSLPFDLKILYEASTDENLSRETRELMIGAIIYTISPSDLISDRDNFASYADDCLLLRVALKKGLEGDDEDKEYFRSRFTEFFESLDVELATSRAAMGPLHDWLASKVGILVKQTHKNKSVKQYFESDDLQEELYEDGLEFRTEYPINEDDISDRFKKASSIIDLLQRAKNNEDLKAGKPA
ncbi:MAG: DUF1232 domain-containing protein [Myxococcales bacterium]|nr:DUF1232 domain-containing protein [Myxococcales bacterium]